MSTAVAVAWQASVRVPAAAVAAFEHALAPFGDLAIFEDDRPLPGKDAAYWRLDLYCVELPDAAELGERLSHAAEVAGIEPPELVVIPLQARDWVSESRGRRGAVRVGRFFIHELTDPVSPPPGSLVLCIEAGQAFGTGAHQTTHACLLALDRLARFRRCRSVLDLGCGSGVLSLAAARLWRAPVRAGDIDPIAVRITRENARINRLGWYVRGVETDGIRRPAALYGGGPHDLVIANILADPLRRLASRLSATLVPGGHMVLSGFFRHQEGRVLAAYRARGLRLAWRERVGDWSALVLRR